MAHRPLYHNTTVVLYVCVIMAKYASASADIERKKKTEETAPPPVCLDQRRPHLEI